MQTMSSVVLARSWTWEQKSVQNAGQLTQVENKCIPILGMSHSLQWWKALFRIILLPVLFCFSTSLEGLAYHSATRDCFPICCDPCMFTGLSITLFVLYWHWYSFGCLIGAVFVSTHGSSLLSPVSILRWRGVIMWQSNCCSLPLAVGWAWVTVYTFSDLFQLVNW